jgi:hypothetical protein
MGDDRAYARFVLLWTVATCASLLLMWAVGFPPMLIIMALGVCTGLVVWQLVWEVQNRELR